MTDLNPLDDARIPAANSDAGSAADPANNPAVERERVSRLSSNPDVDDAVVREYEDRYNLEKPKRGNSEPVRSGAISGADFDRLRSGGERLMQEMGATMKRKEKPLSYSAANLTDQEKLWAGIAHGSVWLTLLGGLFTGGMIVPLSIFVPLIIYFAFRSRSNFVAFHAMQAFVLILLGTVGAAVVGTVGGVLWVIGLVIAMLLMLVLIGFILVPLWALVGLVLFLVTTAVPIAMLILGTIAAIETYKGRDYRYPIIARWVDRQLSGSFLRA